MKRIIVSVTDEEYAAIQTQCAAMRIKPSELAWSGLNYLMETAFSEEDQNPEEVYYNVVEIVNRFDFHQAPEWAAPSADQVAA